MKTISISFDKGIQFPPKLGTLILRPTSEGKASYAQNINVSNDSYGNGVATAGPAMSSITNESTLTGSPLFKMFYGFWNGATTYGWLYFAQSILGVKTIIRRVKDVYSGGTPSIDTSLTASNLTINHSSHANQEIVDMVHRPDSNNNQYVYVAGKDDTDTWLYKFNASDSDPSTSLIVANSNFSGGFTRQFLVFSSYDNNIYWIGQRRVSSISTADAYTANALSLGLPLGTSATCGADWQQQLVVGYSNSFYGNFDYRKSADKSGIVIWDYVSTSITKNIPAPCRYISAIVPTPSGQLLVFGGVSNGKSAIYNFTGYGFTFLTEYIGDLPRSKHSIEFDSQGRILWMTADGQLCRYNLSNGIFEHLGSVSTSNSAGGLLANLIGSPVGNEYLVGSGSGSNYYMKIVKFDSFAGDSNGSDGITTPLIVSGTQLLKEKSTIQGITLHLAKSLQENERVELRLYPNGSTTYTTYLTMDYTTDGAISSKKEKLTVSDINNFNIGVVYKMADANTSAPPILNAEVEVESIYD